jgi:hypothetical protein
MSADIQRVNGVVIGCGRVASMSVPWPLLICDVVRWLQLLPTLHDMNREQAIFDGDPAVEERERERGEAALRCLEAGVCPSPDDHPFLALRLLCDPVIVCAQESEDYFFRLAELYPGSAAEPFFVIDGRDGVMHLVNELEFLGELVGPGMLSTVAPAEWLVEYSRQLLERHGRERVG